MDNPNGTFKPPLVLIGRYGSSGAHSYLKGQNVSVYQVSEKPPIEKDGRSKKKVKMADNSNEVDEATKKLEESPLKKFEESLKGSEKIQQFDIVLD